MAKNGLLADDVDLQQLAAMTKNYTGAEIEAVCRSASSFALFGTSAAEALKAGGPQSTLFKEEKVCMKDFRMALDEIKPAFGVDEQSLESSFRGGMYNHGPEFNKVYKLGKDLIESTKSSSSANPLLSVLLEG